MTRKRKKKETSKLKVRKLNFDPRPKPRFYMTVSARTFTVRQFDVAIRAIESGMVKLPPDIRFGVVA